MFLSVDEKVFRDLMKQYSDYIILDVRMREEYEEDRICNSILCDYMHLEEFKRSLEKMDKEKLYFVYCMTGHRSEPASELMRDKGFKKIVNLKGGFIRYKGKICTDNINS